jgi:hypothetical protein
LITGSYYITGEINDWSFKDMRPSENDTFVAALQNKGGSGSFLIVRNKDFNQIFHPSQEADGVISGPSEGAFAGRSRFTLPGARGEAFKVTFRRCWTSAAEARSIKFEKMDVAEYEEATLAERGEHE